MTRPRDVSLELRLCSAIVDETSVSRLTTRMLEAKRISSREKPRWEGVGVADEGKDLSLGGGHTPIDRSLS